MHHNCKNILNTNFLMCFPVNNTAILPLISKMNSFDECSGSVFFVNENQTQIGRA